ncbi:MAG: CPBP family intramembrane metalloprotease [Saccharofermentans sp.]|nr:CPBP family intramembrane metalloprotease [Saccharofermentans sp.]
MKIRNIFKKIFAILFSIFMGNGLIHTLSMIIPNQLNAILPSNSNYKSFVVELIGALISLGLIFLFHKTNVLKISGKSLAAGLICGLPVIITYSLLLISSLTDMPGKTLIPEAEIVCVALRWFLIGIAEEGLFRGVIQELFMDIFGSDTRKGIILSIICTATLFGLNHFQNLLAGVSLTFVLIQFASATAAGLMFGAITYRSSRSIWPLVLIHALVDASSFIHGGMLWGASDVESINSLDLRSLILVPIFTGIFIYLMRKSKTEPIIEANKTAQALG